MEMRDIVFWLIIIGIIAVALWMLHGSPTDSSAIITLATFTAASEILIWRALFSADKKTAIGFEKVKSKLDIIDNKLNNIQLLIKK